MSDEYRSPEIRQVEALESIAESLAMIADRLERLSEYGRLNVAADVEIRE